MPTPIQEHQWPAACRLLAEGFPGRSPDFWAEGLRRLQRHTDNDEAGIALGHLLWQGEEPVGIALSPASRRTGPSGQVRTLINFSSLYVRPEHRWRTALLARAVMADPQAVYTDLTPTPEVQKMLPMLGFAPVNEGTSIELLPVHALRPSPRARVREWRPADPLEPGAPPARTLQHHRELGCVPLVLEHAGGQTLLVYRSRPLRGLRAVRMKYIGSHAVFERHLPALARHLLWRGFAALSWDARGPRRPGLGTLRRPRGVWYARGDRFDDRTDFIGSELCILGV